MLEVRQTDEFAAWLRSLVDARARGRIAARIDRMALGNPGDVAPVGEGVSEMRIHYGPGYRVYFIERGAVTPVPDADFGSVAMPGVVPRFSATPGAIRSSGPALGAHNAEVYGDWLGLSEDEQARLREAGAI